MTRLSRFPAAFIFLSFLLSACATPDQFVSSTGKFASSTADLADAAGHYLEIVDRVQFETELVRAQTKGTPIPKSSLAKTFFDPTDMAARRSLLAAMRSFAGSLAKAADRSLGEEFRVEVNGLKGDVLALRKSLDEAQSTGLRRLLSDQRLEFSSAVEGGIGQAVVDQMQAEAIVDVILAASPAMSKAADLLAADMSLIFEKLAAEHTVQVALTVEMVNAALPSASQKDRSGLLRSLREQRDKVIGVERIGEEFKAALRAYQKALIDMTAFARTKRDPKTLPDAVASVEVLVDRTKRLISLVRDAG